MNPVDDLFAPPANALPKTEEFALGVLVVPKMFDVVPDTAPPCFEASDTPEFPLVAGRPKENWELALEGSVILGRDNALHVPFSSVDLRLTRRREVL